MLLLASCFSSKTIFDIPQKVTGEIMVVGNEPFTKLAVRTASDKVYIIRCDRENRQILLSHQGKIAELAYNEIQKTRGGEEISVIGVKILSK